MANPAQFKLDQLSAINAAQQAAIAAEESTFNMQSKKILLRDQLSNSSSERGMRRLEKVDKVITIISNFFSNLLGWLFRGDFPLAHYITLLIVILFMFGAFKSRGGRSSGVPNLRIVESTNRFVNWIKRLLKKYFGWLIPSSYRLNLISNLFTPFSSTKLEGIARNTVVGGGRCDQLLWKEEGSHCRSTSSPKPLQWIMDVDKMPEFNDLPAEITTKLSQNRSKLIVNIPYGTTGIEYMPDCSKMTFADGSKANLFTQRDIKDPLCRFVEKPSTLYNTTKKRADSSSTVYQLCGK